MNSEDEKNSESFFNSFEEIFFLTDLNGRLVDITPYALHKLGVVRESVVGQPMFILHPPERRDDALRQFKAAVARKTDRYAIPLVGANDTLIQAETRITRGVWKGQSALLFLSREITERLRLEETLRETEIRFQEMADCAPVMLWTTNESAACLFFNKTWLDFTGRTLEQEISVGWTASLHPEDFHHCLDMYHSALQARRVFEFEFRFKRRDGEYRPLFGSGKPRFTPNNTFIGYIGSFIDVTEHRRAEATLRAAQAQLESVIQLSSDAIICTDETQRITLFNENAEIMFGYQASEILGSPLDLLLPARFVAAHHRHINDFAASPPARRTMHERTPIRGRQKDGAEFLADASISKSADGDIKIFTVRLRNFSERQKTEETLRYQASALNKIKEAVVVADQRFNVVFWNRAAERIFGWTEGETLGRDIRSIIRVSGNDTSEDFWLKIVEEGNLKREGVVYSRPGREVSIALSASPILENAGVAGVMILCRDITQSKQAERKALQADKLQAIGRLAAGIAHEIRNPVAIIASSLAAAKHTGVPSDVRDEMLDIAVQEAKRLERLSNDFLSYARTSPPQKRPTSPSVTLGYVATVLKARAAQSEISFTSECPQDPSVSMDAFQIHQALLNLAINALEATPKGGAVRLRGISDDEASFSFIVENSGEAIPDSEISHIFEPFFTTKPKGTGLGLAIAQNIIVAHGGAISLLSNKPGCVQFGVALPK